LSYIAAPKARSKKLPIQENAFPSIDLTLGIESAIVNPEILIMCGTNVVDVRACSLLDGCNLTMVVFRIIHIREHRGIRDLQLKDIIRMSTQKSP
jgi:hypothetical protein